MLPGEEVHSGVRNGLLAAVLRIGDTRRFQHGKGVMRRLIDFHPLIGRPGIFQVQRVQRILLRKLIQLGIVGGGEFVPGHR